MIRDLSVPTQIKVQAAVEMSTNLRKVLQYLEKTPTTIRALKAFTIKNLFRHLLNWHLNMVVDVTFNFLCSKSKSLTLLLFTHLWTNLFRGHLPLFSRQQLPRHRRISQENHTEIESQYMATLQHID